MSIHDLFISQRILACLQLPSDLVVFSFLSFFCLQTHTLPPNYFSILNQIYFKLPWKFDIFYTKLTIHTVLIFIINLCFSPSLLLHAIHRPIYVLFVCQKGLGLFFFLVPSPAESPLLKFCCSRIRFLASSNWALHSSSGLRTSFSITSVALSSADFCANEIALVKLDCSSVTPN